MSLFSLKNKSILITGSSKGIGKSIAHQSALMGAIDLPIPLELPVIRIDLFLRLNNDIFDYNELTIEGILS
jgi:hypothetical protein